MNFPKQLSIILFFVFLMCILTACSSGGKNPVQPVNEPVDQTFGAETDERNLIAVYDAVIDPDAGTFEITPVERQGSYHFPLTQLYPGVLQITGFGFTPYFWADIKLAHPMPGSGIVGFDPRVIAILPANTGNEMYYPVFNVRANNAIVLQPDGYTKMYDALGGSINGNTNPFRSYFTTQPYHAWLSSGMTEETKRWYLDLTGFDGPMNYKLVVDVCTNYPAAPAPVIDNASEPVEVNLEIGDGLAPVGGEAIITATFLDWQGPGEIKCKVEAPDLFNGTIELNYSGPGPNPNEYLFTGNISNELSAPPEEYTVLLAAWDINVGNHIFNEAIATVQDFDIVDITPQELNFPPNDISVQGNYAYLAAKYAGLHIIDITDPVNPSWVNSLLFDDGDDSAKAVFVSGDYAYVAAHRSFYIVDINPPESASVVKELTFGMWNNFKDVYVTDGYAYVANSYSELLIIDVDPPESAYEVKSVETPQSAQGVVVSGEYAYVADHEGLQIIDVVPPSSATLVKSVTTPGNARAVDYSDGYAYVADGSDGIHVIDVDPIGDALIVHTVVPESYQISINISGNYAYAGGEKSLNIMDISTPETAFIMNSVYVPGYAYNMDLSSEYSFIANSYAGMHVMDIDPPASAYIVTTLDSVGSSDDLYVSKGYAYIANEYAGLKIVDVDPPESTYIVNVVDTPGAAYEVMIRDGYAYVADNEGGFHIIDIDPPETAFILNTVETTEDAISVTLLGGYAYVFIRDTGLAVIDIDPIGSASIVHTIPMTKNSWDLDASGNYVYVENRENGLRIIDATFPESAYIVHTVPMAYCYNVFVEGDIAYVLGGSEVTFINIEDPPSAYIIDAIELTDPSDVFVTGGYAYVVEDADDDDDFSIVHVTDPTAAELVEDYNLISYPYDVHVVGNHAYVTSGGAGLRILELW